MTRRLVATPTHTTVPGTAVALRTWAFVTGYVGAASALAPALFFLLADPYGVRVRTWFWLGPANDALSIVLAPALIIAAVLVWRVLTPGVVVGALTFVMSAGYVAMAVVTVLMLAGRATLDTQYLAAVPTILVQFGWFIAVGFVSARRASLTPLLSRWAFVLGIGGVAAIALFGAGFAMPAGSVAQSVLFIIGGILAGVAFMLVPVWWILLGVRAARS